MRQIRVEWDQGDRMQIRVEWDQSDRIRGVRSQQGSGTEYYPEASTVGWECMILYLVEYYSKCIGVDL